LTKIGKPSRDKEKEELDRIIDEERLSRDETYPHPRQRFSRRLKSKLTAHAIGKCCLRYRVLHRPETEQKNVKQVLEKLTAYFKSFWIFPRKTVSAKFMIY
jgi:hypothetical protein